jgi:hypothetical protein
MGYTWDVQRIAELAGPIPFEQCSKASMRAIVSLGILLLTACTSVQTKVEIEASAKDVREVLFDFGDYPKWNPFIVKVDGSVAEGSTVSVTVMPVGKKALSGRTVVTSLTDTRLAWTGALAIPGLFRGDHEFIIEEQGPNKTTFYQNEKMSGIIIPFFDFKPEAAGFVLMNQALKKRAERSGS